MKSFNLLEASKLKNKSNCNLLDDSDGIELLNGEYLLSEKKKKTYFSMMDGISSIIYTCSQE